MIIYMKHWWSTRYVDGRSLQKLRLLNLVSSILLFIVRIFLMIMIYKIGRVKIDTEEPQSLNTQYNKAI